MGTAERDEVGAGFLIGLSWLIPPLGLVVTVTYFLFTRPCFGYWVSIVALYFMALLVAFRTREIAQNVGAVVRGNSGQTAEAKPLPPEMAKERDTVNMILLCTAVPLAIPFVLAIVTGFITKSVTVGLASWIFYAIIQVVALGTAAGQERLTNRILEAVKLAVPILSLIMSVVKALAGH